MAGGSSSGVREFCAEGSLSAEAIAALRSDLLHGSGVARLRALCPPSACSKLRQLALNKAEGQPFDSWPGVCSKRVKDPLEWGGEAAASVLNEIAANASSLLEDVLGPRAWFTSVHPLILYPVSESMLSKAEEARIVAASLHSDYPYGEFKEGMDGIAAARSQDDSAWQFPEGGGGWQFPADFHQPRTLQFTVVLDEFSAQRGATRLLPGSARLRSCRGGEGSPGGAKPRSDADALGGLGARIPSPDCAEDQQRFAAGSVAVEGSAGDAIVYIGHTWHTISVNRGSSPRVALLIQASPFYFAPLEALAWVTPLSAERRLSRRARELLGLPGTTVEGTGGHGEESSRVPHRSDPRPLTSCAQLALDTLARLGPRGGLGAAGAATCAAVVQLLAARAPKRLRALLQVVASALSVACGYTLGVAATVRRFDF